MLSAVSQGTVSRLTTRGPEWGPPQTADFRLLSAMEGPSFDHAKPPPTSNLQASASDLIFVCFF